ncbi:aldo/keto reductase [Polyangium jinanense]|uniref:Aldo/keto reductase n=1 Tax=Polyangium jinanense TaxID=2829994 RepID=A0A9X3X550_9BACT|nr:aldo/keto reductase [Polyangium jinanense]MDC3957323.1 aldo/keto reductase [Polyangium jinanense]MDC3982725.1 aldo/keto reductase [Polyangium jinanense]
MRYKKLGTTSIEVSAVIFGGWQAGKESWVGIDDDAQIAAHRVALDAGVTTFDTAEEYGAGHSERILAKALAGERERIVILTKVSWNNLRREKVIEACERSLKNLGTDRIDLYQIHWPAGSFGSEVVPIEETMGALVDLKAQGKIRAIGVSNFDRAQIEAASRVGRVDSLQPCHSLFFRKAVEDTFSYCQENGISVLAYSPLAQGLLTGKFGRGHVFAEGDNRVDNRLFRGETFEKALAALEELRPIAARNGVTLANLALAWLVAQKGVCAIVGARNEAQARENARAGDVTLGAADLAEIDRIGRVVSDSLPPGLMWDW